MTNKDDGWKTVGEKTENENGKPKTKFEYDGQVYDPYGASKTSKLPVWLKASFMKWWMPGAVFYFISFGIEGLKQGNLFALILGIVWGTATDILLNHFLREMTSEGCDYTKYIFIGRDSTVKSWRRFITLPLNILYGIFLCICASWTINGIISLLVNIHWLEVSGIDEFMFAVSPIMFATIVLAYDLICTFTRNLIEKLKLKRKKDDVSTEKE